MWIEVKDGEANPCNATLIAPIKGSVNQRVKNDIIQQINDYPTDELVLTKHTALSTYQRFIHILILVNYQWNLMKFWG